MPPQGGRKHPYQETIQINTTNILFICGGAFDGLDKIIESRLGENIMGFNGSVELKSEKKLGELFSQVLPKDLVKFGLIPEFIGRVPVVVSLNELNEDSMLQILTEPKNALVKQYQRLFEIDGVKLEFTEGAIRAIARKANERNIGARGLRAIMENAMMDMMFRLPSDDRVGSCLITEEVINGNAEPELGFRTEEAESAPAPGRRKKSGVTSDTLMTAPEH